MKKLAKRLISSKLGSCLLAGLWFAVAAMIPVGYYLLRFGDGLPILGGSVVLTALVPVLFSSFIGIFLGSNILDEAETKSEIKAIGLGFTVAVVAYLALFIVPAMLIVFTSGDIFGTVAAFIIFFLYSLLIVGWLVAIVGATAGFLLYLLRLQVFKSQSTNETEDIF